MGSSLGFLFSSIDPWICSSTNMTSVLYLYYILKFHRMRSLIFIFFWKFFLLFHINFTIILLTSIKNHTEILIGIMLNLFTNLGRSWDLYSVEYSKLLDSMSLQLFRSLISFSSVKWSEVAQSCPTLCDPWTVAYQSGSSIHGIFQARVLEWIAISFSRGSSRPRNQTRVSHIAGRRFTI